MGRPGLTDVVAVGVAVSVAVGTGVPVGVAVFVAVGALHLPGDTGLVAMLRKNGYVLEPLAAQGHAPREPGGLLAREGLELLDAVRAAEAEEQDQDARAAAVVGLLVLVPDAAAVTAADVLKAYDDGVMFQAVIDAPTEQAIRDAFDNLVTTGGDATVSVALTLTSGTGTLGGTTSMNAVAGIADFAGMGLNIDELGSRSCFLLGAGHNDR